MSAPGRLREKKGVRLQLGRATSLKTVDAANVGCGHSFTTRVRNAGRMKRVSRSLQ
jgi:hypothetical protein